MNIVRFSEWETNMEEGMYRTMYPTSCTAPKFYGLPKSIKQVSLRPIVSSRGSVTYGVAKVIAKILKPLVGNLPHHIQSTSDFVSKVREITLLPGECLMSYDVTTLFTSVPIDPAINIKICWKRMTIWVTELYYQYRTSLSCWGSVCIIHTFRISIMNSWRHSYGVTGKPHSS